MKRSLLSLLILLPFLLGAALFAQPQRRSVAPPKVRSLQQRLEALDPSSPLAYFELAEEIAAEAVEPEHTDLAKTLFVLAFVYDRESGRPTWISPSACLALADASRLDRERRWLIAMAKSLDRRHAPPDWNYADPVRVSDETAYLAASAISAVRSGEGRRARDLMDRPEVRALIDRYETLLSPAGLPGEAQRLVREAQLWPCPECLNQRVTRKANVNPPEYEPCVWCRGNPGMKLAPAELVGHLRFESRLLAGIHRSWSAQLASDGGSPVRDPDPDELAPTLGVDPRKAFYRNGRWVESPDQPSSPG